MTLLTRYVTSELVKQFVVALVILTSLLVVWGVYNQARDQGLGPSQVIQITPFILPDMLRYTIPGTILFAASLVYGRIAGQNELIAVKSLGINPMVLIWPGIILSLLLSLATVWLNEVALTWSLPKIRRVVVDEVEQIVYSMLKQQKSYTTKRFTINVKDVEGKTLIHPTFTFLGRNNSPPTTMTASEAWLEKPEGNDVLIIALTDCVVQVGEEVSARLDYAEREIPLDEASRAGEAVLSPSRVPMTEIPERYQAMQIEIEKLHDKMAAQATWQLMTGDFRSLVGETWSSYQYLHNELQTNLYRLKSEPWRRWAAGFSCICFVLVGAPMAILRKNSDYLTSFFLVFAPILVLYYPLLVWGVNQAKSGTVHPSFVWFGNIGLAVLGYYLLRKVLRY